jgi:chromosome segregation ATPase
LPVIVMAEGNETQGGDQGARPEGPGRRAEGDLLAERRARRAAETGEAALTRRAEAAEATVQTLERHVASLQQRLLDAEQEARRMAELLEAEKALTIEREHELRRVKQREYAEQQLRVEAEDRLVNLDRESRAEIERLGNRLSVSEREARALADRLESVQRQLAEAEQAAAAERAAVRRGEQELRARLSELELRAAEIQRGLESERAARERSERLLESMRDGHRQMEVIVGDMKGILARLLLAFGAGARAAEPGASAPAETRGAEMADALAAAVERLRQRAQEAPVSPRARAEGPIKPPAHKHSMSLITRWRIRRKQRRAR